MTVGAPVFLLLLLAGLSAGMEGERGWVEQRGQDRLALDFGFSRGGSSELTLQLHSLSDPSGYAEVLLVPPSGIPLLQFARRGLCEARASGEFSSVLSSARVDVNSTLAETAHSLNDQGAFCYLLVLSCPRGQRANYSLSYRLLNPPFLTSEPFSQLSTSYLPNKVLSPLFAVIWVGLCAVWAVNWLMHRDQRQKLHLVISVWPLTNVVYSAVDAGRWAEVDSVGRFLLPFAASSAVFQVASECTLFLALLLIAHGWGIVRPRLGKFGFLMAGVLALYAGLRLLATFVPGAFLFAALPVFALVAIFVLILWTTNQTVELLKGNTAENIPEGPRTATPIMLKRFRWLLLSYIVVYVLIQFIVLFLEEFRYIGTLLFELEEIALAIVIGIIFRLRRNNMYYMLYDEDGGAEDFAPAQEETQSTTGDEEKLEAIEL